MQVECPRYSILPTSLKRYFPSEGDPVVGTVLRTQGVVNPYILDIGSPHLAFLDPLAFDGASKMNRPKLAPGDVVYAYVLQCDPALEVELSCCASGVGAVAKDWTSGEALFGPLSKGTVLNAPISFAADLFTNRSPLLILLGDRLGFEICIGLNGRIWVSGNDSAKANATISSSGTVSKELMSAPLSAGTMARSASQGNATTIAVCSAIKELMNCSAADWCDMGLCRRIVDELFVSQ